MVSTNEFKEGCMYSIAIIYSRVIRIMSWLPLKPLFAVAVAQVNAQNEFARINFSAYKYSNRKFYKVVAEILEGSYEDTYLPKMELSHENPADTSNDDANDTLFTISKEVKKNHLPFPWMT